MISISYKSKQNANRCIAPRGNYPNASLQHANLSFDSKENQGSRRPTGNGYAKNVEPHRFDGRDDSSMSSVSSHGSETRDAMSHQRRRCPSMKSFRDLETLTQVAYDCREIMNSSCLAAFWNQASTLLSRNRYLHDMGSSFQNKVQVLYKVTYKRMSEFLPVHLYQTLNAMRMIVQKGTAGSRQQKIIYDILVGKGLSSKDGIFQKIASAIVNRIYEFSTASLALVLMSFVHIELIPEFEDGSNLFDRIGRRSITLIGQFSARSLSNLAWAFAKAFQGNPRLFKAISNASMNKIDQFNAQDISNLLYAFARAEVDDAELFRVFAKRAMLFLPEFKPQELTAMVHAYAIAKKSNPILFKMVGEEAIQQLESFTPQNLSGIVWAYATAGVSHPSLFAKVADRAIIYIFKFTSQNLANTAWAYSTAHVSNTSLFDLIANEAPKKLKEFEPQHLSNLVWAYATSKAHHKHLFESVASEVLLRKHEFNAQQVSNLIWSYSYLPVESSVNKRICQSLEHVVISCLDDCSTQFLANIAWSYAVSNIDAPFLFRKRSAFINCILSRRDEFELRDLCQLHQWVLWRKELDPTFALQSDFEQQCHAAYIKRKPTTSTFQDEVMLGLKSIGLDPKEEFLTGCGYTLDALIKLNGEEVGVEVDGPHHFANQLPLGKFCIKHRQILNIEGIRIISLPYWEWEECLDKESYLRLKLEIINGSKTLC